LICEKWGTEEFAAMMMPSLESDPRLLHNARLIELPWREATFILSREADTPFDSILEFLTGMPVDSDSDRALATVLFCDIVGSTERAAELGDVAWRRLLDRYSELVRNEVTRFGGREVDTLVMAFSQRSTGLHVQFAVRSPS